MVSSGTYEFGPSQGSLVLDTGREGMAKKIGHDLVIEARQWRATVIVDADDLTRSTATVTVDTRSLAVVSGAGGAKPLSDKDRKNIKENIDKKVLKTDKFPEITFTSSRVESKGRDTFTVHGDLTILGTARPASMDITVTGNKATGTMHLKQTDWGIKPFSALMGALKLADALTVTVEATSPPSPGGAVTAAARRGSLCRHSRSSRLLPGPAPRFYPSQSGLGPLSRS